MLSWLKAQGSKISNINLYSIPLPHTAQDDGIHEDWEAIVGGVVGGFFFLLLIILLIYCCCCGCCAAWCAGCCACCKKEEKTGISMMKLLHIFFMSDPIFSSQRGVAITKFWKTSLKVAWFYCWFLHVENERNVIVP